MESYDESIKLYQGALESAGTTQLKYNTWLESTEAHMNKLKTASEELWINFFNSESIRASIDGLTSIVSVVNRVIEKFGSIKTVIFVAMAGLMAFKKGLRAFDDINTWKGLGKALVGRDMDKGWWNEFAFGIRKVGVEFKKLIAEKNAMSSGFADTFKNVSLSLGNLGIQAIGATLRIVGLKLAVVALNGAISLGFSYLIGALVSAIDAKINEAKKAIESTRQAVQEMRQNVANNSSNIQSLQGLSTEYDKLSNKMIKTTSEQKRFHEISNQIAQISPDVVSGYDAQGNALLNLKDGVDGVIKSLQQMNEFEYTKLLSKGKDGFTALTKQTKDAKESIGKLEGNKDRLLNQEDFRLDYEINNEIVTTYAKGLTQAQKLYDSLGDKQQDGAIVFADRISQVKSEFIDLEKQISIQNNTIKQAKAEFLPYVQSVLNTTDSYKGLNKEMQNFVYESAQSLDFSTMGDWVNASAQIRTLADNMNKPEFAQHYQDLQNLNKQYKDNADGVKDYDGEANKLIIEMAKISKLSVVDLGKLLKLDEKKLQKTNTELRSLQEIMEEVGSETDKASDVVSKANGVLEKHAETGEWDLKTIMELSKEYDGLLGALGDDIKLEQEIINIKNDRIKTVKEVYKTELDTLQKYVKEYVDAYAEGYQIDFDNFVEVQKAKAEILAKIRQEIFEQIAIITQFDPYQVADEQITAHAYSSLTKLQNEYKNVESNFDKFIGLKSFDSKIGEYLNKVGSKDSDGKKDKETEYESIIEKASKYSTVVEIQNNLLSKQDDIISSIQANISELGNDGDYTKQIELQNKLLDEQKKKQEMLQNNDTTLNNSKQKILEAFWSNGFFVEEDLSGFTKEDFDKRFDNAFAGTHNFGTGEGAKEEKEAYERYVDTYKGLVDEWLKVDDAVKSNTKNMISAKSDIVSTTKQIDSLTLNSITDRYSKLDDNVSDELDKLSIDEAKLDDNDIEGKEKILNERRKLVLQNIENTKQELEELRKTTALTKEGQKELNEAIEATEDKLRGYNKDLASSNAEMKDILEDKRQAIEDVEKEITDMIKKQVDERKKKLEEEYDKEIDLLNKKKEAYNRQNSNDDKQEAIDKENKKLTELRAELSKATRDMSDAGKARAEQIKKEIEAQDEKVKGLNKELQRDKENNKIEDDIRAKEEQKENAIKDLEKTWSDNNIAKVVAEALKKGFFVDVNSQTIELQSNFATWMNQFNMGVSTAGQKLQREFLDKLSKIKDYLKDINDLSAIPKAIGKGLSSNSLLSGFASPSGMLTNMPLTTGLTTTSIGATPAKANINIAKLFDAHFNVDGNSDKSFLNMVDKFKLTLADAVEDVLMDKLYRTT